MLSDDERREIEAEMTRYPTRRAACVDAMKIVQRHRGWVSDESLQDIAGLLQMTLDELDGVATFYNLIFRRPVGRHLVLVCNSVSCWMLGADRVSAGIAAAIGAGPGETTPDGRFTLLPIVCLGACDHAPALMVDGDLHGDVDPAHASDLLARYR
ncbi:MAG TPA: NADH-quinone oxidoreductase subunit NuoE [Vicinamibacterales bacterium]|nr:NADH-quinone oxidoreductase subunit NuoE [Vicinamibacterales bacterium]